MESEIRRQYRAIRLKLPSGTSVTVLHIGEQVTSVATGTEVEPEGVLELAIGSRRTAEQFFFHVPPSPGELENAIMQVEDEITRAREMIEGYPLLITVDATIREIAQMAGTPTQVSIDAVEQAFSLLAAHSLGWPAPSADIAGSPAFAATLLILREFMHHLKFLAISVTPLPTD